ncbi:multidrug and toxin extrusion protein 1-like [Mizuhopecten yessoensis]|uniref:multidrug and toxin extrusion protein 1-like n=1 Tax=Mizuhopecten yessoensis TaxID=6573 RepID=UPI000B45C232|nr:multidrug and toxin extrusion protein 1-like [Mizuhopecten yessoensis]
MPCPSWERATQWLLTSRGVFKEKFQDDGYRAQLRELLRLSWPMVLTYLSMYSMSCVSIAFCGQFSKEALDGASLSTTITNVLGTSVMVGLSSAFDTLFPQTYGSGNQFGVGIILQRGLIILFLACFPCIAIFINTEHLLLLLGQEAEVSRLAGLHATAYSFGLPGHALTCILLRYLQCQGIVIPNVFMGLGSALANVGIHWLFVFYLDMGTFGAGLALGISRWLFAIVQVIYVLAAGVYKDTWSGWSRECLFEWGTYLTLAIAGMLMLCLEWWCYEILVFLSGLLGATQLAAFTIVYNVATLTLMIPYAIGTSASVIVGSHLGAGDAEKAKVTYRVVLFVGVVEATIVALATFIFKDAIPVLFSPDLEVQILTSTLLIIAAIYEIFQHTKEILCGVLRGAGHQIYGALSSFFSFYLVALSISIPLLLLTELEDEGAWWGACVGVFVHSVLLLIKAQSLDWQEEVNKAQGRAGLVKDVILYSEIKGGNVPTRSNLPDDQKIIANGYKLRELNGSVPPGAMNGSVSTGKENGIHTYELVDMNEINEMHGDNIHLTSTDFNSISATTDKDEISIDTKMLILSRIATVFLLVVVLIGSVFLKLLLDQRVDDTFKYNFDVAAALNESGILDLAQNNSAKFITSLEKNIGVTNITF